jgi:hypothetical protein
MIRQVKPTRRVGAHYFNFTIEWKGHSRIEGDAFIYVDRKTGGTRAILGYPTQRLEQAARSS